MNDLEYQENLARMDASEIIEAITRLTEAYSENLAILLQELLIRFMQQAE